MSFLDRAGQQPVPLAPATWTEFEDNNCVPSANRKKPAGAWEGFEPSYKAGGRVPVFFVGRLSSEANPEFSFGLTRLYRKPHKFSIGQVLLRQAAAHKWDGTPDFAEHLFGYVHEPDKAVFTAPAEVSRRGRIAVGFATAPHGAFRLWPDGGQITTVMGAPKASYAPFYLSGPEKDWSSDQSGMAGRKRYLVRDLGQGGDFGPIARALEGQAAGTGDTQSRLRFITPTDATKSRLTGTIRLTHVSRAEIGAVLWAIGLGGDAQARHQIGRAKAFGAGQVRAAKVTLHWRVNDAAGVTTKVDWHPSEGPDNVSDFLKPFGCEIAGKVGLGNFDNWMKSPQVHGLLATARPRPFDEKGTSYLPFEHPGFKTNSGKPKGAGAFAHLRDKTRIGAGRVQPKAPDTLLPAAKKP